MSEKIHNPILRGFHPDPSIARVEEDYYIATSTFEWWPGIRLHHSRDLIHWNLVGYALNRISQLDLRGVGPSQGVWAPCLTWHDGMFYLVFTVVKAFYCNMYDTENYLITAKEIGGPWSEPVALSNFGFDPSLFHDDDGRKYIVSMVTDHRIPKKYAGRLVLQEFDARTMRMTGPIRDIYQGKGIFLEGPHIFKRDGLYYLFCADTGTGEGHGQTILRAKDVWGPYEMYKPQTDASHQEGEAYSILTSRHHEEILLQKAGHCDLVETPEGEWYAVHLCGRATEERNPLDSPRFSGQRRYMIGRETAVQKMRWTRNGWLELASGGSQPQEYVDAPTRKGKETAEKISPLRKDDFDTPVLHADYQSLRVPMDGRYLSLTARPGWLRMFGRSGLSSYFSQSLIARRMTEYHMRASTCVDFAPQMFKQMAGLILLYDTDNYLYLHVTCDEELGKCIALLKAENRSYEYLTGYIPVESDRNLVLALELENVWVHFSWGYQGEKTNFIGPRINASFLSDEACREGWFTGTMIGICCQDLTGFGRWADFDWFTVDGRAE